MKLTSAEQDKINHLKELKIRSGTHSPSPSEINEIIAPQKITIDACFLSNPYATDLFMDYLKEAFISNHIREYVEHYPSQNHSIAKKLSSIISVNPENMLITNGAIEGIELIVKEWTTGKILINIPTFSSYYEFCKDSNRIIFNNLEKDNKYKINLNNLISTIDSSHPEAVIIINPNNPDGNILDFSEIEAICIECERRSIKLIIDESFIHLSQCFDNFQDATHAYLLKKYENLIIVKSLSKDFGIAGLRLGYILANKSLITNTLKYGKLWNTNGIAEFFIDTLKQKDFIDKYEECRRSHISDTIELYNGINSIPQLKPIKPHTNFVLVDIGETDPNEFTTALLIKHGILVRSASDKIGLQGNYIRIATRRKEENSYIINAIKTLFAE